MTPDAPRARPVRVGVNLLWLVPGVVGGSEEYTCRLLAGLAQLDPTDLDVTLFCLHSFVEAHPELAVRYPTVTLALEGRAKSLRVAAESSWLAAQARRRRLDLFHHAGGVVPPVRSVPSVLTVHDLQPLLLPENFSRVKLGYLRTMLPRSVRAARLVVTPSDHAGQSVVHVLRVPPGKVITVPHGIEPLPPDRRPDEAELQRVRRAYDLDRPWFVYPAITYPHKNHRTLVEAFARLVADHPDVLLVLTGGPAQSEQVVRHDIDRLGVADRVRRVGRVPRADLDALLDGAVALCFPSVFEGFGAPVLEAMARGCPVVAADATALPEVVGDAGVLVGPHDIDGWAVAMGRLLDDPAEQARLAQAGIDRAAGYGWDRAAEALAGAYRRAATESPAGAAEASA